MLSPELAWAPCFVCAVLLAYLHAAFGAFRPSYSYYDPNSFSFMQQQGYMGLTYPHPDRLAETCCSDVPAACSSLLRFAWRRLLDCGGLKGKNRTAALVAGGIVAYYFLFNASFYWWKAGLVVWTSVRRGRDSAVVLGPRRLPGSGLGLAWRRVLVATGAVQRVRRP